MRQRIAVLAVIGALTASTHAGAQQTAKQAPPPLSTPKPFVLPPKSGFTLANGMKVTLVPFGKIPKVTVVASVLTGNIDEKANEVWLADVTGEMMREGTTSRSASAIATQVAGMGGQLTVTVGSDDSRVSSTGRGRQAMSCRSRWLQAARGTSFATMTGSCARGRLRRSLLRRCRCTSRSRGDN